VSCWRRQSAPGLPIQLVLARSSHGWRPPLASLVGALADVQLTSSSITLREGRLFVAEHLAVTGALTPLSLQRFTAMWANFDRFAVRAFAVRRVVEVTPAVTEAFVLSRTTRGALPSPATCRLRRTAVSVLFREMRSLRLAQAAPTLDLQLPSRVASDYRPLTDDEVEACRWASLATMVATRQPAVMALAEAGTWPVEVNEVRVGDIDLDADQVRMREGPRPSRAPCR
jgi:hypothetical protein